MVSSSDTANIGSCAGLPEAARRPSLFTGRTVAAVERAYGVQHIGARNTVQRPAGATIILRAEETDSVPWLQRLARCHLDLYAQTRQSPADDPLSVPGADVEIREVHGGYSVRVTASDRDAANEVFSRATALSSRSAAQ